ncbi:MAG: MFS transporter [Pseudomonas sp.]
MVQTIWTSAAPAMSYPLYAAQWGLSPSMTTAIFAVFPIVVVAVLIVLGDLSDHIGRRSAMLLGLSASLLGVLLFALASNLTALLIGRALMGFGVGLSAGPSAAALVEFSAPGRSHKAGSITTAAQALGMCSALLIGGAMIQYLPLPTRLNFWFLFVILLGTYAFVWQLPRHTKAETRKPWRLKLPSIPRSIRTVFLVSMAAVLCAYSLGAVMLSLGSQIAKDLIHSDNTLVNGAAISLFALIMGLTGIAGRSLGARMAIISGGLVAIFGMVFLALATWQHTLLWFLFSSVSSGAGYSLLFMGGLNWVNSQVEPHHRAGTLSGLFVVAYLMQGLVALLLGFAATHIGLDAAIDMGCLGLAMLAALVMGLAFKQA